MGIMPNIFIGLLIKMFISILTLFIITLVVSLILFATMSDSEDRRMKREQKQRRKAGGRS